jgi:alkanesulfonate monooxygenase SsuD/methylene tetrahydromethanopterin reductase-like flavin-dependent oxidoreductase (luciferase family)
MVSQIVTGVDEAEYRSNLAADAARRGTEPGDLEERLRGRGMLCGTTEQVVTRLEEIAAMGVRRLYLQYYADLSTIEPDRLTSDFGPLRAAAERL